MKLRTFQVVGWGWGPLDPPMATVIFSNVELFAVSDLTSLQITSQSV